tara:strand:- start:251 stop:526 length:276 start_codon:yes stop_codon:yes gene_type:complete
LTKPTAKPSKPLNWGFFGVNLLLFANKGQIMKFSNEYNALVSALTLAITAPDDDKAAQCVEIAEQIAVNMSEIEVERAKREAETNAREPIQ